jgi:hypothetical protein
MSTINLRFQVSLFGNFDEIIPDGENMKFFIDEFSDKGMIPNQYQELTFNIDLKSKQPVPAKANQRISLTDSEKKWNIKFNTNRIDIIFNNSNIGVIEIIPKEKFLLEVIDFLTRINKRFSQKYKRIGFVSQYLIEDIEIAKSSKIFVNTIDYFKEKSVIEWNSNIVTREKLTYQNEIDELVNINSDARWMNARMTINSKLSPFKGVLLNFDVNTIPENNNYRFDADNIQSILNELFKIENNIFEQTIENFK